MSLPEEDISYSCPYCGTTNSMRVDQTAGSRQSMITDCENCCRPIEIEIDIEPDGYINLIAKREGEG